MYTMHPVIVFGSYRLDPERLPPDEFEERLRAVRAVMRREGWHGLVVHGDAQDSALLTWLTNAFPRLRFQLVLVGLEGEPIVIAAGSTRDLPAAAALTWCRSFCSFNDAPRLLAGFQVQISAGLPAGQQPTVAVHGLQRMRLSVRATVREALGEALADANPSLDPLLQAKRPRELSVMRDAHVLLGRAVQALRAAWLSGRPVKAAVREAEHAARRNEAQDVRILFSLDGGASLQPFESNGDTRGSRLVCLVAVRYLGYWAQAYLTEGAADSAAYRAAWGQLQSLRASVRPGVTGRALAAALPALPPGCAPHPICEGRLAHGVGLCLDEQPWITSHTDEIFREGGVYVLRAGCSTGPGDAALLSRTVCIVDGHVRDLETLVGLESPLNSRYA
ncbi:MAG: hypothetical protein RI988_2142 [Pseudomonadota bacterium]|jgi:Xaa-Pro aminopeptidase